jgi:hypothetical protein
LIADADAEPIGGWSQGGDATPTRGSSRISSDAATGLRGLHNIATLNSHGFGIPPRLTDLRNESVALRLRPGSTTSAHREIAPFHST